MSINSWLHQALATVKTYASYCPKCERLRPAGVSPCVSGTAFEIARPHPAAARSMAAMSNLIIILLMAAKTRAETRRAVNATMTLNLFPPRGVLFRTQRAT